MVWYSITPIPTYTISIFSLFLKSETIFHSFLKQIVLPIYVVIVLVQKYLIVGGVILNWFVFTNPIHHAMWVWLLMANVPVIFCFSFSSASSSFVFFSLFLLFFYLWFVICWIIPMIMTVNCSELISLTPNRGAYVGGDNVTFNGQFNLSAVNSPFVQCNFTSGGLVNATSYSDTEVFCISYHIHFLFLLLSSSLICCVLYWVNIFVCECPFRPPGVVGDGLAYLVVNGQQFTNALNFTYYGQNHSIIQIFDLLYI
jgi:hypothetical protein